MTQKKRIKVLIVDDSPVIQQLLFKIFISDPEINVVGIAKDGKQAVEMNERLKPDVITMDINMPKLNGVEATSQIMATRPTPIVVITIPENARDVKVSFQALQAGALAVREKPPAPTHPNFVAACKGLVKEVKMLADIKVFKRRFSAAPTPDISASEKANERISSTPTSVKLVAIGASTGGPPLLKRILSEIPEDFPVPILIVQHIAIGFTEGLRNWLDTCTALNVKIANEGEKPVKGNVYIAPDDYHMKMTITGTITLTKDPSEFGLRPTVNHLFNSVADFVGPKALGVLLTGMGRDGAEGLLKMHQKGAITIAQDEQTSTVFGMPAEAIKLGAAKYILPDYKIGSAIRELVSKPHSLEI
jgi:two-component system chemotaxis response regulator CheB